MLLSSNVIYICVRVVKLVRMIHTRLFVAARVKSCPDMHSSCVIASLSGCILTVGALQYQGVAQELTKAHNQSWKPQGPVGLLWVHWVSCWNDPYK